MDRRKTPAQYTTEELLKGIEQSEPKLSETEELIIYPNLNNDVSTFLSVYDIQPGKDTVPHRTLYELYKVWSKNPISKDKFELEIGKYLLSHLKGPKRYYLINQKALRLTKAAWEFILKRSIDKTKSPPWKRHFDSFIEKYSIKPGNYFLESYVLYDLYDQYVYEIGKKQPLGEHQFINFCRIYFPKSRLTESRISWFGVDKSIKKHITKERLQRLRKSRYDQNQAKNKKK